MTQKDIDISRARSLAIILFGSKGKAWELQDSEGNVFSYQIGYSRYTNHKFRNSTLKTIRAQSSISWKDCIDQLFNSLTMKEHDFVKRYIDKDWVYGC